MNDLTLRQAFGLFLNSGRMHWAPRTLGYYEKNVGYFLRYAQRLFGLPPDRIRLSGLPEDVLAGYVIWLRSKSRYDSHPLYERMNVGGAIKSNTVNTYMRAAKAFFNYLYENQLTPVCYTGRLKLPRPDDDQILPLSAPEVASIDSLFDRSVPNDLRNLCIFHLMLDAGLRSCEVVSLEAANLIFASGAIVVNRSKANKSRAVVMSPPLASLLRGYVDVFHPSGRLFSKARSREPIDSSVVRSLFTRIRRNTGISRIHPHLCRHTFATSYIMGGGNLETLRLLMGHSDYSVTRKYLHLAGVNQILGTDIYRLDPVFFKNYY